MGVPCNKSLSSNCIGHSGSRAVVVLATIAQIVCGIRNPCRHGHVQGAQPLTHMVIDAKAEATRQLGLNRTNLEIGMPATDVFSLAGAFFV